MDTTEEKSDQNHSKLEISNSVYSFFKTYLRAPSLNYMYPVPLNPNLTTSYLQISSIPKGPVHKSSSSFSILPSISMQATGQKIKKKSTFPSIPCRILKNPQQNPSSLKQQFLVFKGNNSELIIKILLQKPGWEQGSFSKSNLANFIWHPDSSQIRFDRLLPYNYPQMVNHFEFHNELSNKRNLYMNLLEHCKVNKLEITDITPKTFVIEFNYKFLNSQLKIFISSFKALGKNKGLWIFKPSGLNRGKGIHIFHKLQEFKELVNSSCKKRRKAKSVIIQKYIENPMLVNSRKFDIRVWVLITHEYKCYICKGGYLRTASEVFTLEKSSINNQFMHLTNNAIQKKGEEYGKFEDGNQLPLESLPGSEEIFKKIQDLTAISLMSVKSKLNINKRQYCFEIFGYDFIVDSEKKVWLIECNTNPCLELSSKLLSDLIPNMLTQAFRLTMDKVFPPTNTPSSHIWDFLLSLK